MAGVASRSSRARALGRCIRPSGRAWTGPLRHPITTCGGVAGPWTPVRLGKRSPTDAASATFPKLSTLPAG